MLKSSRLKLVFSCWVALAASSALAANCSEIAARLRDTPANAEGVIQVVVKAGLYECAEPLVITRSGTSLIGLNRPVLKLKDHANTPVIVIGDARSVWASVPNEFIEAGMSPEDIVTPTRVSNVRVAGFEIDGNRYAQDWECWASGAFCDSDQDEGRSHIRNNGITLRGAEDVVLEDLKIHSARSGGIVSEKHCARLHIRNVKVERNYFDGFAGYQTIDSVLEKVDFSHNDFAGVSLDLHFNRNVFRDSVFSHNGHSAIFARMSHGNTFDNIRMTENGHRSGSPAIFLAASHNTNDSCVTNTVIHNSLVANNRGKGLRINDSGCTGTRLVNTRFYSNDWENMTWVMGTEPLVQDEVQTSLDEDRSWRDIVWNLDWSLFKNHLLPNHRRVFFDGNGSFAASRSDLSPKEVVCELRFRSEPEWTQATFAPSSVGFMWNPPHVLNAFSGIGWLHAWSGSGALETLRCEKQDDQGHLTATDVDAVLRSVGWTKQ